MRGGGRRLREDRGAVDGGREEDGLGLGDGWESVSPFHSLIVL